MCRYLGWLFWVMALWGLPAGAVTLQVQTDAGDTTFFAPIGDTVSVAVQIQAEGQVLTGIEIFFRYDPRLLMLADTLQSDRLLGQVLEDTSFVLSDSVGVIHYAEANLGGSANSGRLFLLSFVMVGHWSGRYPIDLLTGDVRRKSVYTTPSLSGDVFAFGQVQSLTYADLPPVLTLPSKFEMKEDQRLVVDLKTWAEDAASGAGALVWQVTGNESLVSVVVTDTLTVVFEPKANFNGPVPLVLTVTDPVGGQTYGSMVLQVLPVNDAPTIIALPDTVYLVQRDAYVPLSGAAVDVDGDVLTWAGEGNGVVQVVIEAGPVAHIFAPLSWVGDATIRLRVRDPGAGGAERVIHVIRAGTVVVLTGDLNGDARVDFSDFLIFAQNFGHPNPLLAADLNGDGGVGFSDFLIFAQNFGRVSN